MQEKENENLLSLREMNARRLKEVNTKYFSDLILIFKFSAFLLV